MPGQMPSYTDGQSSTSTDWDVGVDNRLDEDDAYTYDYNGEGQLTKRTSRLSPSLGANDVFRWDPAGRLISVTQNDSSNIVIQTIARFAAYKEELARLEFSQQARWKPASGGHGDELVHHAYNRHPSLATNNRGLIDPALYDARAWANIVRAGSEMHSLGNGRYAAFDPNSGGFTVFSWQGQGGLPAETPTIHSYYIPLRNQMKSGVPFNSQGVVNLNDVRPR